ncbi:MAG TPA: DUF1501 domain-containing protein [Candidatus Limnocylindria bacterium]|jgi:uncharacterized protein (DUF1501 family)|nr:DUF1501 domain-containing protein [Candidatus Limnocylindria bacterium]
MREVGINRISRREFMKNGFVFAAGAAGLAAGYAAVPDVFARAVYAAKKDGVMNDKVLVMIQLAGGADGLQTVMPLQDSRIRALRPRPSAAIDQALPLAGTTLGLNRNLRGIKSLYDQGKVAIVNGVGYPKPSLSHFDSIRVWETADPTRRQVDGWLGKTIAKNYDSQGHPLVGCACGTSEVPGALRDLEATLSVVNGRDTFKFNGDDADRVMGAIYNGTPGIYGALFDTSVYTARDTIARLRTARERYTPKATYNDNLNLVYSSKNQLGAAMRLAAELVISGVGAKILHVTLGGWDTHDQQLQRHDQLMAYVDQAVSAFHADLTAYGMADRVLVATWSEFGRRAQETASAGTDHGTASSMFIVGDRVKGGVYGEMPNLTGLDRDGNLRFTVDFRSVYQEILASHLKVDAREVLDAAYERLPFVKAA